MSLLHLQIYKTFSNPPSGIFNKLWVNLFRQATVALGGGEEGFFGGEGEVVGAAGDDGLGRASVSADVDERPASHLVGEVVAHQCQAAVNFLEVTEGQHGGADAHHRTTAFDTLAEGVEPQHVAAL